MNFFSHIVIVVCSLFTKQVCLQTVQSDDALWTPWDFEINYYFIYNNLRNPTIIITQQQNYTSCSSYSFFVQGLIKKFNTIMLQSCPALIIKKACQFTCMKCAPPCKSPACADVTKYLSKWQKLRKNTHLTKKFFFSYNRIYNRKK
jgi:hypothetical protein